MSRKKGIFIVATVIVIFFIGIFSVFQSKERSQQGVRNKLKEISKAVDNKLRSLTYYEVDKSITVKGRDDAIREIFRKEYRHKNKYRIIVTDHNKSTGKVFKSMRIFDGENEWTLYEDNPNIAMKNPLASNPDESFYEGFIKNYDLDATEIKEAVIDNRKAWMIQAAKKQEDGTEESDIYSEYQSEFIISSDGMPLHYIVRNKKGNKIGESKFGNLKTDQSFDETLFAYAPGPDVKVGVRVQ